MSINMMWLQDRKKQCDDIFSRLDIQIYEFDRQVDTQTDRQTDRQTDIGRRLLPRLRI